MIIIMSFIDRDSKSTIMLTTNESTGAVIGSGKIIRFSKQSTDAHTFTHTQTALLHTHTCNSARKTPELATSFPTF